MILLPGFMKMTGQYNTARKKWITVVSLATVILLLYLYGAFDPADNEIGKYFPKCLVKTLTGLQCPSCGVQRAAHSLLQGDVIGALSQNWFLIYSLSYFISLIITRNYSSDSPLRKFLWGKRGCLLYVFLYFAWFILRNILDI